MELPGKGRGQGREFSKPYIMWLKSASQRMPVDIQVGGRKCENDLELSMENLFFLRNIVFICGEVDLRIFGH